MSHYDDAPVDVATFETLELPRVSKETIHITAVLPVVVARIYRRNLIIKPRWTLPMLLSAESESGDGH